MYLNVIFVSFVDFKMYFCFIINISFLRITVNYKAPNTLIDL